MGQSGHSGLPLIWKCLYIWNSTYGTAMDTFPHGAPHQVSPSANGANRDTSCSSCGGVLLPQWRDCVVTPIALSGGHSGVYRLVLSPIHKNRDLALRTHLYICTMNENNDKIHKQIHTLPLKRLFSNLLAFLISSICLITLLIITWSYHPNEWHLFNFKLKKKCQNLKQDATCFPLKLQMDQNSL